MLNFNFCRMDRSVSRKVASSVMITAEGQALVVDNSVANGVKPSAGVAGEKFAGVSISQQLTLEVLPKHESLVVDGSSQVTLSREPVSGTLRIFDETNDTVQSAGTPGEVDNEYSISGKVVTFNAARQGDTMSIAYRYNPTVAEAKTIQGDILPGGQADALLDTVGVLVAGDVYTTEYDTSVDWSADPVVVSLGANGLFTVGGSGVKLDNVRVIERPSPDNQFLGLSILNG